MIIAAKCAPEKEMLNDVGKVGLKAVELYLSDEMLKDITTIVKSCKLFPLRFAIHAPNRGYGAPF